MCDKIYSVYVATNPITGKSYVGTTVNYEQRLKSHKYSEYGGTTKFSKALQEYWFDNFNWEIVYQTKDADHCYMEMEYHFIDEYDSRDNGYNSTRGGCGANKSNRKSATLFKIDKEIIRKTENRIPLKVKLETAEEIPVKKVLPVETVTTEFPKLEAKEALSMGFTKRTVSKSCRDCGDKRRFFSKSEWYCYGCCSTNDQSVAEMKRILK